MNTKIRKRIERRKRRITRRLFGLFHKRIREGPVMKDLEAGKVSLAFAEIVRRTGIQPGTGDH